VSRGETVEQQADNAIKAGGDNGSVDGPITKDSLDKFVGQAGADLSQATKDFQTWQKANPNADATATELARSAVLLEANASLLCTRPDQVRPGGPATFSMPATFPRWHPITPA
jgi:hypothetical protein